MNDTNRKFKKEKKFIQDFKINQAMLAEIAGCSPGNFHDKINEKPGHRFTDVQKDKITVFLRKLAKAAAKI